MNETSFSHTYARVLAACTALVLVVLPQKQAGAQIKEGFDDRVVDDTPRTRLDTLARQHKVHVSPHIIVFDERTNTATVTFSNTSDRPIQGMVLVLFAYPDWPHGLPADTTVLTPNMSILVPRDTVVLNPGPKDPFAGPWLSGLPTALTLAPHQTQRVTLRITPPNALPNGEYWARVVALVRPQDQHRTKGAQDVKQHYAMPIKGGLSPLRDSVVVFYRKGPQRTGIAIAPSGGAHGTAAEYDNVGYGGPDGRDCPHSLWVRVPMHLTGTSHVEGTFLVTYRNVNTGAVVPVNKYPLSLYRDAVTHWWTHTCWVPAGTYKATLRIEPIDKRLPFTPVTYTIPKPFDIRP